MRRNRFSIALSFVAILSLVALADCDIDVKKEANGQDKQVDIKTPVGGIHVSQDADASQTGLPLYPGARLKQKDSDGSDKSANVNISGFGFGLKVVALDYESDDAPETIVSFYKDRLKKYGNILECHTSGLDLDMSMDSHDSSANSSELTCPKTDAGKSAGTVELKVGKKSDQHIVAVEPQGKGASFSLVYVRTHGKDSEI